MTTERAMNYTQHADRRMNQRGISKKMTDLVLQYGKIEQDKRVLNNKDAKKLLQQLQDEIRIIMKIIDKGGMVVVSEEDSVITTYKYNSYRY